MGNTLPKEISSVADPSDVAGAVGNVPNEEQEEDEEEALLLEEENTKKDTEKADPDEVTSLTRLSDFIDIGKVHPDLEHVGSALKKKIERKTKHKYFDVIEKDEIDPTTGETVNTTTYVAIRDNNLASSLASFSVCLVYDTQPGSLAYLLPFLRKPPQCPLAGLLMRLPQLKLCTNVYGAPLVELIAYLDEEKPKFVRKIEEMLKRGKISYDGLWYLFERGHRFSVDIGKGTLAGSRVAVSSYMPPCGLMPARFNVVGEVIKSDGIKFYAEQRSFDVPEFEMLVDVSALPIQPMTKAVLRMLTRRGQIFEQVAIGAHYKNYQGFLAYRSQWNTTYTGADGRVMVDIATFNRRNPQYTEFGDSGHQQQVTMQQQQFNQACAHLGLNAGMVKSDADSAAKAFKLNRRELYKTWPYVAGFSFHSKSWGEILVSNLSDIVFDDKAYDQLVLPAGKKQLIKALVMDNHSPQIARLEATGSKVPSTDIISGKGGGVIFLLHGPPGVGKTLTAEAIAELLHHPLYSVSVGELGTSAESLEERLNAILELARLWNAVVLLDEADIFLEKRTEHDVLRNAMVGIFLRKLEYHQGVMFLTTNRVSSFDPAFNSRINVAIKYKDLTTKTRAKVWDNLMRTLVGKEGDVGDTNKLAEMDLNGRQIRTTLRLALALARSEQTVITNDHVLRTIQISNQFYTELAEEENKQDKISIIN
jgi:hypothetical protein